MGRNFTMYRNDMTEVGNFTVHDVGGHHDLVNGSALDVFTQTIDDAWAFLYANCWVEGGSWYAWVEWEE
jgi:3D (Asp-Asp-Asp) domain-containing protein